MIFDFKLFHFFYSFIDVDYMMTANVSFNVCGKQTFVWKADLLAEPGHCKANVYRWSHDCVADFLGTSALRRRGSLLSSSVSGMIQHGCLLCFLSKHMLLQHVRSFRVFEIVLFLFNLICYL